MQRIRIDSTDALLRAVTSASGQQVMGDVYGRIDAPLGLSVNDADTFVLVGRTSDAGLNWSQHTWSGDWSRSSGRDNGLRVSANVFALCKLTLSGYNSGCAAIRPFNVQQFIASSCRFEHIGNIAFPLKHGLDVAVTSCEICMSQAIQGSAGQWTIQNCIFNDVAHGDVWAHAIYASGRLIVRNSRFTRTTNAICGIYCDSVEIKGSSFTNDWQPHRWCGYYGSGGFVPAPSRHGNYAVNITRETEFIDQDNTYSGWSDRDWLLYSYVS